MDQLIADLDAADSSLGVIRAVVALAATRSPAAIVKLIEVLRYNNPGAAVAAVEGLVAIGEPSVLPLLELLDGYNYGARAWAMRALSQIGDPRAIEALLEAMVDFSLSVRRAAAKGVGSLQWQQVAAADLDGLRSRIVEALAQTATDDEWVVRYATVVGLQGVAQSLVEFPGAAADLELRDRVLSELAGRRDNDTEAAVRVRAIHALTQVIPIL
ncbi:MAG: HEAT repeat domain-containing protein [Oscillatoriales cyanobacterium]|nr:MAG: HEAT repeat domain-containing protein [Oscillatoriales cyanobacterium]